MQHSIEIDVVEHARYLGKTFGSEKIPSAIEVFLDSYIYEEAHDELDDGVPMAEVVEGAFSSASLRVLIEASGERDHPLVREILAMTGGLPRGPLYGAFILGFDEAMRARVATEARHLSLYLERRGDPRDMLPEELDYYLRDAAAVVA